MTPPGLPLVDRITARLVVEATGCWTWTGAKSAAGYGQIRVDHKALYTHRIVYEMVFGPIPDGHHVHHECGNRVCCNPAHLTAMLAREHSLLTNRNADKSHCPYGHEYTPENTIVTSVGGRQCRACGRRRGREQYLKRKARGYYDKN